MNLEWSYTSEESETSGKGEECAPRGLKEHRHLSTEEIERDFRSNRD